MQTHATQAESILAKRIRLATERSTQTRNRYTEQAIRELTEVLDQAEQNVKKAITRYASLGSLPDNKLKARDGLERLQADIQETMRELKKAQTLRFRRSVKDAFKLGIQGGVDELVEARWPGWSLDAEGVQSLARDAFTLIDRDALDFMVNYSLVLAGDVQRELSGGIKRTILSGITTGKGPNDIVRDLGRVVQDPESFRHAGSRVFSKAQYRMEVIARTEVLRAHNQGRMKFHREVGVQRLEWLTMADERTCPVCGPLDGKVFPIDRFPQIPRHPQCRCGSIVALPIELLAPQQIRDQARSKTRRKREAKLAFEAGGKADLASLTYRQLADLSQEHGVSRSRTKRELVRLLDQAEPGIDHGELSGAALRAKLAQHGIGRKRSKTELANLLARKQAALLEARKEVETIRANPKSKLWELTVNELQGLAKKRGISTYLSRAEVIELLDERDPGRNHVALTGKELAEAKKRFQLGRHKTKSLLIRALEKQAGLQLAEDLLA
ncbi:Minor capsid protein [Sulfidibacter corallicola]|uniref:Minor capsid protein n=1 Tax=Sulfidibacter corallicola TaxID=2818388 RepID=A0A8A4TZ04_SULCO|nr:minor capsid protein [Sulfidibacter corallicola]QTD54182.1 minor capsid protein [Sulfidibacter corallicola]